MKKLFRVFLGVFLCGLLPVSLLLCGMPVAAYSGGSSKDLTDGADIRVMSYNVLVDNDESLGGWSWGAPLGNRGDKASAAINYYRPDVIGFQECNYKWHVNLRKNLPDYDFVNADVPEWQPMESRENLGKEDWMCTTMMYNTKTLELVDNELVGYTVNYWGSIQRMRYISMALFKVKKTGEKFVFTSTHFDAEEDAKGDTMRCTQAGELADRIRHYMDTYGCPVVSVGDYNSQYKDAPISLVREKTGMISHPDNREKPGEYIIDYILYSAGVSGKYFTVVKDADLSGASDHKPIFADLQLKDGYSFPTTSATIPVPTEEEPLWSEEEPMWSEDAPQATVEDGVAPTTPSTAPSVSTVTTKAEVSSVTEEVLADAATPSAKPTESRRKSSDKGVANVTLWVVLGLSAGVLLIGGGAVAIVLTRKRNKFA